MAETTGISWCDHTMNFWIGCTKVSPACDGCYAEAMMDHRHHRVEWGGPRSRTSAANWREPYRWDKAARAAGGRKCAGFMRMVWAMRDKGEDWLARRFEFCGAPGYDLPLPDEQGDPQ